MSVAAEVREATDRIEEAYEFMLAYAAQGRNQEAGAGASSQIRQFLERFASAVAIVEGSVPKLLPDGVPGHQFGKQLVNDAAVMKSIIELLISKPNITSEMIDNTNGLIAVRAFLTDLFFIDHTVLPPRS